MIAKLIFGRALPMGAAALLLHSSYSPIEPALRTFRAATRALAGESVANSGAHFAGTASAPPLPRARGLSAIVHSLFGYGPDQKALARKQLDDIIRDVKRHGAPPAALAAPLHRHMRRRAKERHPHRIGLGHHR